MFLGTVERPASRTLRIELSKRQVKCVIEPTPECAIFSFSDVCFQIGCEFSQIVWREGLLGHDQNGLIDNDADWREIHI